MESLKNCGSLKFFQFALQVVRGRWFMMFASFLIMSGAGASYVFGSYSSELKKSLGYDQKTLNLIGFFKDLGAIAGVISGVMAELTPTWFVLLIGAGMNFFGYFMVWLSVTDRIAKPHLWQMCIYIFTGTNSQAFANTGVLVACVHNFPESRGIMLGLLKGFTGLSGAVMIQIYHAVYGNDSRSLILLIGWLPAVISIFFVYTIRIMKKVVPQANETRVLYHYLYISISLASIVMVIIITQKLMSFSHAWYVVSATVVCILLMLPLVVAVREELVLWNLKKQPVYLSAVTASDQKEITESSEPPIVPLPAPPASNHIVVPKPKAFSWASVFKTPERGEDYTIMQGLFNIDMLIIFIATFCGYGTNLTAIDNLGQIGQALGYPQHAVDTCVSLVSIWNYCGRVSAGFVSEYLVVKFRFPRPLMLTVVLLLSCIGQMLVAFPIPGSLYCASLIIGFSYGAVLIMIYTLISELFGLKHYATLFNWGQLSSPLGSYVLNVRITGVLYDREALRQLALKGQDRGDGKELTCIGKQCYRLSFLILAAVSIFGALSTLVLAFRTRSFYEGDIYKKFREEAQRAELEIA